MEKKAPLRRAHEEHGRGARRDDGVGRDVVRVPPDPRPNQRADVDVPDGGGVAAQERRVDERRGNVPVDHVRRERVQKRRRDPGRSGASWG